MSRFTDPEYLQHEQYKNSANLQKRVLLHEKYSTNPIDWHVWVFSQMQLKGCIVELGCGNGLLWRNNRQKIKQEWCITLSDISAGMLGEARQALETSPRPLTFAQLDARGLPFPNHSLDVVIANHMLYHIPNVQQALGEVRRVLKDDGVFYAATNGRKHLMELYKFIKLGLNVEFNTTTLLGGFSLETGGPLLAEHFSDIEMNVYNSQLCVTEVDPLLDYTASMVSGYEVEISEEQENAFRQMLQREIDTKGAVWIQKATGLFCARC